MAADIGRLGRRFEIGRVARQTFALAGQDFLVNFAIAVALGIVPVILSGLMSQGAAVQASAIGRPGMFGTGFLFVGLLNLVQINLAYGAIIAGSLERLQGRNPSLGDRLRPALNALATLIGVAVLGFLGIFFATLLLIVPGVLLALMWIVVFPVAVAETRNVFTCFSRSSELTKGSRLSIFLLLVAIWLGAMILSVLAALVIHAVLGLGGNPFVIAAAAVGPVAIVALVLQLLISAAIRVVWGAGLAALYHELLTLKGGFDARRLGEVFA